MNLVTICVFFIPITICRCNGQDNKSASIANVDSTTIQKSMAMEQFDRLIFEKNKVDGEYNVKLQDGTEVRQWESPPEYYVEQAKKPGSPYESYKMFYYKSGSLKKSGTLFYGFNVGIWKTFDEMGNNIETQNYDERYTFSILDLDSKMRKLEVDIMVVKNGVSVQRTSFGQALYFVTYPINSESPYDVYELKIDGKTGETLDKTIQHKRN